MTTTAPPGWPPGFQHKARLAPAGIEFGQPVGLLGANVKRVSRLPVAPAAAPPPRPASGAAGPDLDDADGGRRALLEARATAERVGLLAERAALERRLAEPCDFWLLPDFRVDRAVRTAAGAALASSRDQLGLSTNLHLVWFAAPDELARHERPTARPWGSFGGPFGLTGRYRHDQPGRVLVRRTGDPREAARVVSHECFHAAQAATLGPPVDPDEWAAREAQAEAFTARWLRYEWPLVDPGGGA